MEITKQELYILLHTLGLSERNEVPYRNHFVAGEGHSDMPSIIRLCEQGFMQEVNPPRFLASGDRVFMATEAGRIYAIEHRPLPPKITRSQARYHKWLSVSECFPDTTFKEFLTKPYFAKYR